MRDLNDEVLGHPYDEELKSIVTDFAALLRRIVETIDKRGLKRRFLAKHRVEVDQFYRKLSRLGCKSGTAFKCRQRFEKNHEKLFTFLDMTISLGTTTTQSMPSERLLIFGISSGEVLQRIQRETTSCS